MEYSNVGIELTKEFEGCRLKAYQDEAGVLTIGYGHTGKDVYEGMAISQSKADELLAQDLKWAVDCVNRMISVAMTQGQFDAMVDFTFNVGPLAFQQSTLRRYVNEGNMAAAAGQFPLWVHAGGHVSEGLVRRRTAEQRLFNGQG